eukprot:2180735-Pyramimonas_sp.AAC.1
MAKDNELATRCNEISPGEDRTPRESEDDSQDINSNDSDEELSCENKSMRAAQWTKAEDLHLLRYIHSRARECEDASV